MNRLVWLLPRKFFLSLLLMLAAVWVVLRVGGVYSEDVFIRLAPVCPFLTACLTDHSFRRTGTWVMFKNLGIPRFAGLVVMVLLGLGFIILFLRLR